MSKVAEIDILHVVNEFMIGKGWKGRSCSACGRTFFIKASSQIDTSICGWHKCDKGEYPFRTYVKRKKMATPAEVCTKIEEYFRSTGFGLSMPLNVANTEGQTDLIVAGVQMFDAIIHRSQPIQEGEMFVAQPCVRMQFQQLVESHEGTSTSFVNVCTEKMNATLREHLNAVDSWCTILSRLGLHMNDFIIVMRSSVNDWGTGEFSAFELFFSYGGLELGDAAYLSVPQPSREPIPISDIGFGLERIVWAMNKTDSYFDTLIPLTSDGPKEMFDCCRTLALLALCGVQASNKGPGLQFRRFSKVLSEKYYRDDVQHILSCYFDYWAQFIQPVVSRDAALPLVRLETERFVNLKVSVALKLPPPHVETTEAYFNRLVYTYGISIHELRKAIQACKT